MSKMLLMRRFLAGLVVLVSAGLAACQGAGSVLGGGGEVKAGGKGGSGIFHLITGEGSSDSSAMGPSSPGGGDGPSSGPSNTATPPDGTLGSQTDSPEITHLDMYIYGQDPRSLDPAAKRGIVRLVYWPSDAPVLNQWQTLTRKQIVESIKAGGIAWEFVQPAKWKDFEIGFDDSVESWGTGDDGSEDMAVKLYFWMPPNTIPVISSQHFADLDQFMALLK